MLFSGDHIMEGSTVVIAPPDGDMAAYLESLDKLTALRPRLRSIAPGHGHLIEKPAAKIEEYIAHRLERERQVLSALERDGTTTIEPIVKELYADVPDELHVMAGHLGVGPPAQAGRRRQGHGRHARRRVDRGLAGSVLEPSRQARRPTSAAPLLEPEESGPAPLRRHVSGVEGGDGCLEHPR